jgi:DNA mismatch repair protein MutS2
MKEELIKYAISNGLSPFNDERSIVKSSGESIFKTRDAKSVFQKVINQISFNFVFKETSNLWSYFSFTDNFSIIRKRQEFFNSVIGFSCSFLNKIAEPRRKWKPRYEIVVVTEDEMTFVQLNKMGCTAILLVSDNDISDLERYDIIQVIDCNDFRIYLERLPQTVFIDSIENVYLERYLEMLSGWRDNFEVLTREKVSDEIRELIVFLSKLFDLMDNREGKITSEEEVEKILEDINERISLGIREMTITGEGLLNILGEGKMPPKIIEIVRKSIEDSGLPENLFNIKIPVTIDYEELDSQIKRQSANEFTNLAERVKKSADDLKRVPRVLERLSALLLLEDFCNGVSMWVGEGKVFPVISDNLHFSGAKNCFLTKASPISFQLDKFSRCSVLTGANSGGKTTLLEHIIQNIGLFQLGLPIDGEVHMPIFSEIYYFAKNKGSASKGAFETLLSQMAKIKPGEKTLILADEIEAVTEPGVAGKIISATIDFFIKKNCFLVIATHLGHEIKKTLPQMARIDGIEAKGLDENFNLIVDHNPVMGRLAHSTPELIVERMANFFDEEYFRHLQRSLK